MDWVKKATQKAKDMVHEHDARAVAQQHAGSQPVAPRATQPTESEPVVVDNLITARVRNYGMQQSNYPHIFRDGGGGGTVGGKHLIIFADGTYTAGKPPTDPSLIVSFVSNSIAVANGNNMADVTDFGNATKGPSLAIPFLLDQGESAMGTAIWPNHNIAPLPGTNGTRGIAFTEVIDRDLFRKQAVSLLYNTPIEIRVDAQTYGKPVVTRRVKNHFNVGEPMFGSFTIVHPDLMPYGGDGYLYMFGRVNEAPNHLSNGLKLARVKPEGWDDRSQYEFWDGYQFQSKMPALDDGGAANVFNFSSNIFGKWYGPSTGDIWWSPIHSEYIMLFQSQAAAIDHSMYLSHSKSLTGGWSKPKAIWQIPQSQSGDGFSYGFHAYPNMDPTGKTIPITWTQDSKAESCRIYTGEVLFE